MGYHPIGTGHLLHMINEVDRMNDLRDASPISNKLRNSIRSMAPPQENPPLTELLTALGDNISSSDLEPRLASLAQKNVLDDITLAAIRSLHTKLEEAGRREGLLRVLYDIATDLTGIRDVEAVLKAIVRRTRALIGSDISYLSLNDYEKGETYIRVTDGATTEMFRNIRIPLGEGVLGAVATGRAPSQSPDYLNDSTKTHVPASDEAVAAEGVRAIMGVPLWAAGKVIGALLVADRHAHHFSSDDIALMETLGAHAAVALENARHFSAMADAVTKLNLAQTENVAHVQVLEELSSLDQRLMETLAAGDVLPNLLRLLSESMDSPVFILSPGGEPMEGLPHHTDLSSIAAAQAAGMSVERRAPVQFTVEGRQYTAMASLAAEQHLASLFVACHRDEERLVGLERSALVLSAALIFERTLQDTQYRLQVELIDELLRPRQEITAALIRRAAGFGLVEGSQLSVRVIGVKEEHRQRALAILRQYVENRPGIVALYESQLCVIESPAKPGLGRGALRSGTHGGDRSDSMGQAVMETLQRQHIQATVGSSQIVAGLAGLPGAYVQARQVLQALLALSRQGEAADPARLGTAGMLLGAMDSPFTEQLLAAQLGPLLTYDATRGTALVHTASLFLDNDSALKPTAEGLHVHVNTLRQRLDRIDAILGQKWRRGTSALDIHVALKLWQLKAAGLKAGTHPPGPRNEHSS